MNAKIIIFGESEKGLFETAYLCHSLWDLSKYLGESPPDSKGIDLAIKSLLYDYDVVYFRVKNEGFSVEQYFRCLHFLENEKILKNVYALSLPGTGDKSILEASRHICNKYKSCLMFNERDLYDFISG
ncbi:Uncharacterized protein CLAVI_000215 [Candidatus Clavichlamydia salmonicola]|uniref:hypothetical protein n=1 Tax=Candidatus Clavichlamydia salmonicola TaxID=469812 RepID=UPI0018912EB9|nr:hypothetical protein [Candidatus Clavichlamydia salmonicola]MBF5050604.1 Uncharacterized protein [Candidatus Clavichlamydia salmonicola]